MKSEAGVILIIAVYMPVECGSVVNREEYISELGVVEGLLEIDDHDQVVLMGDFNADIRRSDRRFARLLNSFLICHNLTAVGLEDASATTVQNTWHSHDFRCESWIDHICVSQSLKGMIEDFKIREENV